MELDHTIAAIATPPGAGAIGIVRLSGPEAHAVADAVFQARGGGELRRQKGYTARLGDVYDSDGVCIDECVALVYRAPKSYTGEDAVELMCHGGELVCEHLMRQLLKSGATLASPGEFTRRALLHGRLTLTEAEAVCDVINAASRQGAQAAAALQGGSLYRRILQMKEDILALQAHIAAAIDFPEEDVEELEPAVIETRLADLDAQLRQLLDSYDTGVQVLRGIPAVIAGSPNVGKSTLLNLLAGAPKAIVTPIAGTTRDIVEQPVRLGGVTLLLADTAGIRESGDEIEMLGIERAIARMGSASLVLAVFDSSRPLGPDDRRVLELVADKRAMAVVNKTDLAPRLDTEELRARFDDVVYISANDPASLDALAQAIARVTGTANFDASAPLLANERQRRFAEQAQEAVAEARAAAKGSTPDVVTALLAEALDALAQLSGEDASEALLDEVFSRFCVGK